MSEFVSEGSAGELINRAVVAARQQQPVQAIDLLGRAIADSQTSPALLAKALLNRGVIYAALNLPHKALPDFDAALHIPELVDPERERVQLERAVALSKIGQHDVAIAALLSQMALMHVNSKRMDIFARALNQARARRDTQDKELTRLAGQTRSAILTKPKRVQALLERAHLLAERGDWAAALDECDNLVQQPSLADSLKALILCNRGMIRASRGRVNEAEQDYRCALAIESAGARVHGNAYNNLGLLQLKNGRERESIASFTQGLQVRSLPVDILYLLQFNRAAAHGQTGQFQLQKEDLDALANRADLTPFWRAKVYNQRGTWYLTRGDWQDARLDFLQVVNDTDPQGDLTALAYINLGVVAGQQQDNDQALDYFSKALEVPDVAGEALSNAYFNRGAALAHLEKTEEAIQSYDAAINQSGADGGIRAMALINRAMLLLEKGQEALAWKDLAILLAQTDAPILQQAKAYALQARIAYKSGQWDEVLLAAQAGLKKIASPELHLLVALAHLWRDDGPAARVEIEHLRQTKDAKAVLQQFRQDLDQAVMEGLSATQADKVRDLLPAAAEPSIE